MDLSALLRIIAKVDYDHVTQQVKLTVGFFSFTLPIDRARWYLANPHILERIAVECIINRRIMTASMKKERVELVSTSLDELVECLDKMNSEIGQALLKGDSFLSTLLAAWRSEAIAASQAIRDAKRSEDEDREAFRRFELLDSDDIITASDRLSDILCQFRRMTFGFAYTVISMMPKDNQIRVKAEAAYTAGFAVGIEECGFTIRCIPEPEWDLVE